MSKLALSSKSRHRSDARSGCASSVAARRWRRGPRQFCAVGARRRSTQRRSGAWESGQPRLGQLGSDSGEIRCACAPLAHRCASGAATRSAAAHSSGEREGREGVLERWRSCAHDRETRALRGCGHSMGVENACERTSSVASVTARFWLACAEHRAHWVKGGCGAAVRAESGSGSGALSAIPLPSASHNQFSRHVYEIHSQTLMEISD